MNVSGTPVLYIGLEARVKADKHCTLLGWLNVDALPDTGLGLLALELKLRANGLPLFDCSAFWRNLAMPLAGPKTKYALVQWNGNTYRVRGVQGTMAMTEFLDIVSAIGGLDQHHNIKAFLENTGTALQLFAETNASDNEPVYVRIVWFVEYGKG